MCAKKTFLAPLHHHQQQPELLAGRSGPWIHADDAEFWQSDKGDFSRLANRPVLMRLFLFLADRNVVVFHCCIPSTSRFDTPCRMKCMSSYIAGSLFWIYCVRTFLLNSSSFLLIGDLPNVHLRGSDVYGIFLTDLFHTVSSSSPNATCARDDPDHIWPVFPYSPGATDFSSSFRAHDRERHRKQ